MAGAWLREDQADLAVDKILDAASRAFVDLGVSRARMGHIAQYAGCSRGTLYRYFDTREELYVAYVGRAAARVSARLAEELRGVRDPRERLALGIIRAVQEVRSAPGMAAWFAPGDAGLAARISRTSEVVAGVAGAFVDPLLAADGGAGSGRLEARWLVRIIVSLLTMPGESEEEEQALVERFVTPTLLGGGREVGRP